MSDLTAGPLYQANFSAALSASQWSAIHLPRRVLTVLSLFLSAGNEIRQAAGN